jgi:predicted Zn-dependent peptidase
MIEHLPLHTVLPNGLEIIAQPMPAAQSIAVSVMVRAGARQDRQPGSAHFLEHMLFKGSVGLSALELSTAFDALGAHANAFTSHEMTTYTASALPNRQNELIALLLGMMQPRLDLTDIELERQVILEEIELYRDDPMAIALEFSAAHYFGQHPLGRPVIGTKNSVEQTTRTDLSSYLEAHYTTSNMVLAVCGIFDWQALLEVASQASQTFSRGRHQPLASMPVLAAHGLQKISHDSVHTHISFIAKGFAAADSLELPAAIAARIIGDSENSRFAWAFVHQGLALSAGLEHEGHTDLGAFYGSLECSPENQDQCLETLHHQLLHIKQAGITAQELSRMKRKLEVGLALRLETPNAWLGAFSEDYVLQNELQEPREVLNQLRAITLEEVNAALEYSGLEQPMVVCLGR